MDFGRLVTAAVTPFDTELRVDYTQFANLIEYLIEGQKTDSIVVCGTTGESPTLTDHEKIELFRIAVQQANGRVKIIAGTGSNDTTHSIHLTQEADKLGVDGILLVTPYYNRPSDEGVYKHFASIAQSTSLPVMIYNIPGRTGINVPVQVTLRLAQIANIVATKEAHSDLDHVTKLVANAPQGFYVYSGDDSLTLPFLSVGAHGIVSVASHVIGQDMKEMIRLFVNGETQLASALHLKLHPIFKGLFECPHRVPNPAPVKHALNMRGIPVGGVRLPLLEVTETEGEFIRSLFS